jgi:prolipoprotein diacylglyceryl transferase
MIFINNLSPILFEIGPVEIRWYGLLFATGLVLAYVLTSNIFRKEGYSILHLDSLTIYLVVGLIIGARLGEVFFYEPGYFLKHPVDILKIWQGGLSSHGATIGLFIAYLMWQKIHKVNFSKYVDALVIGFPIVAAMVRIGNFFNSEIVGLPTNGNFGVVFKKLGEDFPRHPVQFYEAFLSLAIFGAMFSIYKKYYKQTPPLFFVFFYIGLYFGGRFFIEFFKDLHGPLTSLPITMGQLLSLPPALLTVAYFAFVFPKQKHRE